MDQNITVGEITFNKSFDAQGMSVRRNSSRGINTPDILTIRNMVAKDNQYGTIGRRFNIRNESIFTDSEDNKHRVSVYTVIEVPNVAATADVESTIATHIAALGLESPALVTAVLNEEL